MTSNKVCTSSNKASLKKQKTTIELVNTTQPIFYRNGLFYQINRIEKINYSLGYNYKVFYMDIDDNPSYLSNYNVEYIYNLEKYLDQDMFTIMNKPLMRLATT